MPKPNADLVASDYFIHIADAYSEASFVIPTDRKKHDRIARKKNRPIAGRLAASNILE
jgi:hypothetical protein